MAGALLVACLFGVSGGLQAQAGKKSAGKLPPIKLSSKPPFDVTAGSDTSLNGLQEAFDVFSWNSFIALNWPAAPDGSPNSAQKPGAAPSGDNDTVWEHWVESSSIIVPPGQTPSFNPPPEIPAACKSLAKPGLRVLRQVGKTPGLLTDANQPFDTGPLIDQSGVYSRFEIRVNQDMFNYILNNRLYSKAGQKAFTPPVNFPCGRMGAEVGAIMVKAAWKIMGPADDPSQFHTTQALVYTPDVNGGSAGSCSLQTAGLVGLHIAHKTSHAPQWIWSTFEHVKNVPTDTDVKNGTLQEKYNFFDPKCHDCPVNKAAPRPWNPATKGPPTQAVRISVIPPTARDSAASRDTAAHRLLAAVNRKSVWQYYELISTQWPADAGNTSTCKTNPADPSGNPAPIFLANSTMETFVQGTVEGVSSSCILCHNNAAMAVGGSRGFSDFTYILKRVQ
jgi:hypothetical protein